MTAALSAPSAIGEVEEVPLKIPFQKGVVLGVGSAVELMAASDLVEPGKLATERG